MARRARVGAVGAHLPAPVALADLAFTHPLLGVVVHHERCVDHDDAPTVARARLDPLRRRVDTPGPAGVEHATGFVDNDDTGLVVFLVRVGATPGEIDPDEPLDRHDAVLQRGDCVGTGLAPPASHRGFRLDLSCV